MLTYEYHNPVWVTGPEIGGLTITNPVGQGHAKDKLGRNNELTYTILNGYRKGGEYQRLSISCFLVATAYPKQTLAEIANVSKNDDHRHNNNNKHNHNHNSHDHHG